jgi:hypothetical protein
VPGFRRTPHSPATAREKPSARRAELGPRIGGISLALLIALEVAGGTLGLGVSAVGLAARRARHRRLRPYGLYRLHLSPHDEAKPQDLEDMVEAIAGLVRAFPADRARRGQPFVAVELRHQLGPSGALEWSISLRCEPAIAVALDGALSAAYPDVRLGHTHGESPQPEPEHLAVPGHVMRFRKARGFVYPLLAAGDDLASPPLEAVAHAQVSLDVPSVIRIALTPAPLCFEALARRLYRAHENRLVRQEHWGLPEGGLHSTLNRAEMTNAQRTQNRSLFWLEAVVAAADRETCRQLGATLQARRGENRLHRRWMPLRTDLYRRRFPAATPPLIPSPRALVSAAEVAHLLALPSARMKGVQVRRLAIPRLPMPPDVLRARPTETVEAPTRSARLATAGTEQTP